MASDAAPETAKVPSQLSLANTPKARFMRYKSKSLRLRSISKLSIGRLMLSCLGLRRKAKRN